MTILGVTTHCNHCDHCQGPYRHYILNALWILINLLCLVLTLYQVGHNNRSMRSSSYFFIGPKSDHCPACLVSESLLFMKLLSSSILYSLTLN